MKKILLLSLFLLSVLLQEAMAQTRTVTGRVTDAATGEGMPGVTVQLKGTTTAAPTDGNGGYSISIPATGGTLVFSFIGYANQEVAVGNQTNVNIRMAADARTLGEVVVIGAGGIERQVKQQGYNSTNVTAQELIQGKSPNIATGLTGKVAGLQINAVGSGVNPTVRVVLRGNRSLTGNNQALIVLDNVIVPNEVLGNLNPEDVESVNVLNGPNAAALYGSDASNGAMVITTKKGKKGVNSVRVSHTTTLEQVSFHPKLQKEFGSGYGPFSHYVPYENQQYGPRFDGSMVPIGKPLENGEIQMVPYSANNDKFDFWETGVQNQTDFAVSSGTDRSTFYISGQNFTSKGTTPKDEYDRIALRVNGTHDLGNKLKLAFNTAYTTNTYDITSATAEVYEQLLNTPAHIPVTSYKDWRNNQFANPNGYFNEYYRNPYFTIDNQRQKTKNNYLVGNVELKYAPMEWMDLTYRIGTTSRSVTQKNTQDIFVFTPYTKSVTNTTAKSDIAGGVTDLSTTNNQINSDFLAQFFKDVSNFNFHLILGNSIRSNNSKTMAITANGLVNPGVFNISNRIGDPIASEANYQARQIGVFGDLTVGFRDYLFLHLTGRNDWNSTLAKQNRSFFYPSADVAFTVSEALPMLQDNQYVNNLKLRAGVSEVGQVGLRGNANDITFGAYRLRPTFSPTNGFPFGDLTGYSVGNVLVSTDLRPERTRAFEVGFDATLLRELIEAKFTYYSTKSTDQTVTTGVSSTTGFSGYLTNAGEVTNKGIEATLFVSPIKNADWTVTVGGNYTYNENKVVSISDDLPQLALSSGSSAQIYAVRGNYFPIIRGSDYNRDDQGRIIVDRQTGLPSLASGLKDLGNTEPIHRLGLEAQVRFKGLRLTSLFEYRGSFYRFHSAGRTYDFTGSSERSASFNRGRFVMPNSVYENPDVPGTYLPNTNITTNAGLDNFWASGINMDAASNYVSRGDYWRFRELSLAYDLPVSLLSATKFVKAASVSVQGRNLILWLPESNQWTDPDYNFTDTNAIGITSLGQTPPTRYYGATVSLTF